MAEPFASASTGAGRGLDPGDGPTTATRMQIIPAIDLRGGKCVRLRQGDYNDETVFGEDPAAMAARWVADGAERLHIVDLDGARDGRPANLDAVRAIVARAGVPCQFGGGVRSRETFAELMAVGVDRVVVGTRAVMEPAWVVSLCREFPHRVCVGLDARDGRLARDGWTRETGRTAVELARQLDELPLAAIVYTDIHRDGMMGGVNLEAVEDLARAIRTPLIASGGVTTLDDVRALAARALAGCIVGRALYEGTLRLPEAIRAAAARASPP